MFSSKPGDKKKIIKYIKKKHFFNQKYIDIHVSFNNNTKKYPENKT